jgi:hypothetical protein
VTQSKKRAHTATKRKATIDAKKKTRNQAVIGETPESEEDDFGEEPEEEPEEQVNLSRKRRRNDN